MYRLLLMITVIADLFLLLPAAIAGTQGQNENIVLMWQVQNDFTDADGQLLKNKHVNTIQSFQVQFWKDDVVESYLRKAQKNGFKVIMSIDKMINKADDHWVYDSGKMAIFINKWKSHPAVFAWHPFDEAADRKIPASFQEEVYKFIKTIDPQKPVFISWNGTTPASYDCCFSSNAFDILDLHAYVRERIADRQRKLIELYKKHSVAKPVLITLRAFEGPDWKRMPADELKEQHDYFFMETNVARNIGFYGWQLGPNKGISQVPDIMQQFKELNF